MVNLSNDTCAACNVYIFRNGYLKFGSSGANLLDPAMDLSAFGLMIVAVTVVVVIVDTVHVFCSSL